MVREGDEPWELGKCVAMVFGFARPDHTCFDGFGDVRGVSWFQRRCAALDSGSVDLMNDVIDFERYLNKIKDVEARAAVCLAMLGWDVSEIGAAVGGRRSGSQLVRSGLRQYVTVRRNDRGGW